MCISTFMMKKKEKMEILNNKKKISMPYPRLEPSNSASLVSHNPNKGISPSLKPSN